MSPCSSRMILAALLACSAAWCAFPTDAPDSTAARALYGIATHSNPASTTSVSVKDGVLAFTAVYANDSAREMSAGVALEVPFCRDRGIRSMKDHRGIEFTYRNSEAITDVLAVGFDTAGSGSREPWDAEIGDQTGRAAGTEWKTRYLALDEFDSDVHFLVDPGPEYWARRDTVLGTARSLVFKPRTTFYVGDGPYGTNVSIPTMSRLTLEIRDIVLVDKDSNRIELPDCAKASRVRSAPHATVDATYRDGILAVERPLGYTEVDLVAPSGRRVATLGAAESRKGIVLESGTWFVVLRGPGRPTLTRALAVAH